MKRLILFAALAAACVPASAYYHFVHYLPSGNAPDKFDLTALPNKTVTFFVSESGPSLLAQNDSVNSVLSQIRQATQVWNNVATSDLRVAFGGFENSNTPQNTPGGDVVFADLPPGLEGYGSVTASITPVTSANGTQFFPIVRSTVQMNRNLMLTPGPSYRETFYLTTLHEIGHALGLQHTFTSSTMSQATTRATTLSHPIGADDSAAVSVLYPNAALSQMGSITGRITSGGKGVHLASVVAIAAGLDAVSALTNPDGTYRIDGIPPGQYVVYAHSLPPDADIFGPWNADGSVNPASGPMTALFYPGTTDSTKAQPVPVFGGQTFAGVNISLPSRQSVELYDVQIFGYFNNNTIAVEPAFVNIVTGTAGVSSVGNGLGANGQAPGLNVQIIGAAASIRGILPAQANGSTYVGLYIGPNPLGAGPGPQHVVFNTPDFMYVLPSGFTLTRSAPPTVTAVTPNGDGTLTVTGTNWAPDSQIYFDGLPATISSLDPKGVAVVTPPAGANAQTATLTVYNSDGQNSQLVQSASPVTYSYGNSPTPVIASISPASLPAGAEAMVDITGSNFNFVPGQVAVGFGTSDILVRRVFVLSPNHLQVDVSVSSNATLSNPDVSVIGGFQVATAPAAFQITPANPSLPEAIPVLQNAVPGLTGAYPGATVSLYGSNLAVSGGTPTVMFTLQMSLINYTSPGQLNFTIPQGLTPGPAVMNVSNGSASAFPVVVNIDPLPAAIAGIQNASGAYVDSSHPAHANGLLIVTLSNFAPDGSTIDKSRVQVGVGGTLHNAQTVANSAPGVYQVTFQLNANETVGTAQFLIVYLDGHSSYAATIPVVSP